MVNLIFEQLDCTFYCDSLKLCIFVKSLNRKMNYRFRDITVKFIFNKIDLKLTSRPQVPP